MLIDLGRAVNKKDVARLSVLLAQTNPGEEVQIVMEAADAHQADEVFALLRREGFDYQPKGGGDGQRYWITARRMSPN
uniref:Uncharacterized protein n=1 Tax=Ammonifex degensii TaxID=42838 RepID=A0A7C2IR45_9THEO